jgi:serine/threonine protein kinase
VDDARKSSYKGMPGLSARSKSEGWGSHAIKDLAEYTEDELCKATGNWSEESVLGKGAHGLVYKGDLSDGTPVAIKKPTMYNVDKSLWDTFTRELELLSKLNHKRLVRLLGYCKDEIILVYEFMENGSLAEHLHPEGKQGVPRLGWGDRLRIAAGAAKGLEYLHEYAVPKIYHGDVKPANILLDQKLDAHVSDFGLSIWSRDETNSYMVASHMGGTFGYLDPEYVTSGQVTFASDVYSFGIVLLELMSSRHVVVDGENIKDWAAHLVEQGEIEKIFDSITIGEPTNISVLISIIHLALECVERRKQDRPKMLAVSTRLDQAYSTWRSSSENIEYSILSPR